MQLWGPRHQVYVVAAHDRAVFSLGLMPDEVGARRKAVDLAARLHAFLGDARVTYGEAGSALGVHPNSLRYAAPTGTVLIRWDGARLPAIWTVPPPEVDARDARLELARRYLHIFGPTTPEAFAQWAGFGPLRGVAVFDALRKALTPVRTPIGDAWILTRDEPDLRADPRSVAPARFLPSGDAYLLLQGGDRELLVADANSSPRALAFARLAGWPPRRWRAGGDVAAHAGGP